MGGCFPFLWRRERVEHGYLLILGAGEREGKRYTNEKWRENSDGYRGLKRQKEN